MKKIKLTQGKVALVDDDDFKLLHRFNWYAHKRGKCFYAARTVWITKKKSKTVNMHNVIMKPKSGMFVDHIKHNTLDNRKSNLRLATRSQNNANRSPVNNASSKYLGVGFEKDRGKWTARIRVNNKGIRLGSFNNEKDAAKAYDKKAIELHGEFANLNFK
jgi:hypothetical protein